MLFMTGMVPDRVGLFHNKRFTGNSFKYIFAKNTRIDQKKEKVIE